MQLIVILFPQDRRCRIHLWPCSNLFTEFDSKKFLGDLFIHSGWIRSFVGCSDCDFPHFYEKITKLPFAVTLHWCDLWEGPARHCIHCMQQQKGRRTSTRVSQTQHIEFQNPFLPFPCQWPKTVTVQYTLPPLNFRQTVSFTPHPINHQVFLFFHFTRTIHKTKS